MSGLINVMSDGDANGGGYGIANYGFKHITGVDNPVAITGEGLSHNVGVDLHPVNDYIYRLRMNGLHGAVNSPSIVDGVAKLDYKGIDFNGIDQSITEDDEAYRLVGIEGAFSVGLWVKPTTGLNASLRAMVSYGTSGPGGTGFQLIVPVNAAIKARYLSNGSGFNSNNDMVADDWNFILYTISGTTRKVYVNGTLTTGSAAASNTFTSTELRIATNSTGATSFFDGVIDDVTIWNRELTLAEEALLRAYRS